ncbi:MAG: hypothetical protein IRZ16_18695, partial [Myxococcaceae bacterium]|nr:hypothetical protein [Myxococcaceae bacterium]
MRRVPLLIGLVAGVAFAQTPGAAPPPKNPAGFDVGTVQNVPDSEKVSRSSESLSRMRNVLKEVLAKLEEARNTKDVVKLNCVNEKLTQIKGLLRISEQADVTMQEAIARSEKQSADHEFTKVMIARQKVEQLRAEAEECIGQLAFRTDENQTVEVEEPEGLPDDPTHPPP